MPDSYGRFWRRSASRGARRGSTLRTSQTQAVIFRFAPPTGQSPRQAARQSGLAGGGARDPGAPRAAAAGERSRGPEAPGHHHVTTTTLDVEADGVQGPPGLGEDGAQVGERLDPEALVRDFGDPYDHCVHSTLKYRKHQMFLKPSHYTGATPGCQGKRPLSARATRQVATASLTVGGP